MIRLLAVALVALTYAALPAGRSLASDPVLSALPPHAHLLAATGIPGRPQGYALTYELRGSYLGVAYAEADKARLLWERKLPGRPFSLSAPGPAGLFQATVKDPSSTGEWLFAFDFRHTRVVSAVQGRGSGAVYGDEGVKVGQGGFSVRGRDRHHVGSVLYRSVTSYAWKLGIYRKVRTVHVPDYPADGYPVPNGTIHTRSADVVLVRLEVAKTTEQKQTGLMYRKILDPDSGMIFVWDQPVHEAFWMENTYIPLTVAFLDGVGRIMETQDMEPLTTTLHTPIAPYQYAIEVNQGFFAAHGIQAGDRVEIHLTVENP